MVRYVDVGLCRTRLYARQGTQLDPLRLRAAAGAEGRSGRRPRLPEFASAEYGAIGHLKADTLLTVNLELLARSEKVTRVASVQVLVATEEPLAQVVFVSGRLG